MAEAMRINYPSAARGGVVQDSEVDIMIYDTRQALYSGFQASVEFCFKPRRISPH